MSYDTCGAPRGDASERPSGLDRTFSTSNVGSLSHIKLTVCAESITELILKRAGPVIFKTLLLELTAFRPIPVICPAREVKPENYWKR